MIRGYVYPTSCFIINISYVDKKKKKKVDIIQYFSYPMFSWTYDIVSDEITYLIPLLTRKYDRICYYLSYPIS